MVGWGAKDEEAWCVYYMDFSTVVERARQLHEEGRSPRDHGERVLDEAVYGRVCSSQGRPTRLSSTPGRKTAFVFGPDAISNIILRRESYQAIRSLGFTKDYITHELIEQNCPYWLILFKPAKQQKELIVPATWDGVTHIVSSLYPLAYHDLIQHLHTIVHTPFADFETEAGFKFLECRRNEKGTYPDKPPYYSYDLYCSLPQPRTALQVRLFLYCELRLLEMFRGDGLASMTEPGSVHCLEYLCPNLQLSALDEDSLAVLPMTHVSIPD